MGNTTQGIFLICRGHLLSTVAIFWMFNWQDMQLVYGNIKSMKSHGEEPLENGHFECQEGDGMIILRWI
jgi:hypothetical protein